MTTTAKILDGKSLAKAIMEAVRYEVFSLRNNTGRMPKMVNILIGSDHGTCAYSKAQKKVAEDVGIQYELIELDEDISQEELIEKVRSLDADLDVNGIMIHKPVPRHIDYKEVANCVATFKDLEGINVENIGKMIIGDTKIIPCTPAAVMAHLKSSGIDIRGKEAVIIGHSTIVGKPLSMMLLQELATVTVCHIGTSNAGRLHEHVSRAEILIVAVGKAGLIKGEWIKEGAVVIDVGINSVDGKIVGDVDFESAKKKASYITPVPGGVGPVTVVMLMQNCVEAFKIQNRIS
jgi:methylenetetrahydrofolate dehydrogenase (NADP+)/methenyltetrahydrofolate cyclohydrolase